MTLLVPFKSANRYLAPEAMVQVRRGGYWESAKVVRVYDDRVDVVLSKCVGDGPREPIRFFTKRS